MAATHRPEPLSTRTETVVVKELNFKFDFIVINLNSHMWPVAPVLDGTSLEPGHSSQPLGHCVKPALVRSNASLFLPNTCHELSCLALPLYFNPECSSLGA